MVQGRKQIKVSGRSSYPSKNISVKKTCWQETQVYISFQTPRKLLWLKVKDLNEMKS